MKSSQSASVDIKSDTTVGELIRWLGKRPTHAKVSFHHTPGDRPFESGQDTLTVTWNEDN